jgi:hypothetical protein
MTGFGTTGFGGVATERAAAAFSFGLRVRTSFLDNATYTLRYKQSQMATSKFCQRHRGIRLTTIPWRAGLSAGQATESPPRELANVVYFFSHLLVAVSHIPPALSQSALLRYCEKSPDGLADGEDVDGPEDEELPVDPEGLELGLLGLLELGLLELGLLELGALDESFEPELDCEPLLLVPVCCAAAIAGAKAIARAKSANISFCIVISFRSTWTWKRDPLVDLTGSNIKASESARRRVPVLSTPRRFVRFSGPPNSIGSGAMRAICASDSIEACIAPRRQGLAGPT